jgi:hypothetical protein
VIRICEGQVEVTPAVSQPWVIISLQ